MRVNKFGSLLFLKIVHTWPYRVFFKKTIVVFFSKLRLLNRNYCEFWIGLSVYVQEVVGYPVFAVVLEETRRREENCVQPEESGSWEKIFFVRSFVSAWVYIVVYRRWYFIFAVAQN